MPGNRWNLPLFVGGLLLSIAQNSAAGWDCQPSPDGKWVCSGPTSALPKPSQQQQMRPEVAETGREGAPSEPAQLSPAKPQPRQVPEQRRQPKPDAAAKPIAAAAADRKPAMVKSEAKVAAPAVTEAPADLAPSVEAAPQGDTSSADEQQRRESTAASEPVGQQQPFATETLSAGTDEPATATKPRTEAAEQSQPVDAASISAPFQEEVTGADAVVTAARSDANIDRGLNWNQCYPWATPAPLSFSPAPVQQMLIDADGAVLERSQDQVRLLGNVQIRNADSLLEADSALYRRTEETLDAEGNVYFEQPGLRLSAAQAHFDLASNQGELEQVSYRLSDRGAHGDAETAAIESRDLSHYKQINYTTCKPGQSGWSLEANELDIDKASGLGTAHHAKLRFKGVPFIYLPYATFPIDDRRMSGFLFPTVGSGDRTGADLTVPYYFNIAPNMDATLTPRIMSKRGLLLGGEYRYLQERHDGKVRAEILPDDRAVKDDKARTRGALSILSGGRPAPGWSYETDINYVSDNDYLDDLGDSLAVTSTQHLERLGQVRYAGSGWSLLGRTQYYQTVDESIDSSDRPYSRLPQFLFELSRPKQAYGLSYQLESEFVNFGHSDNDNVIGQRFDLQPSVSLPLSRRWGYLIPKASLRYTSYNLENQIAGEDDTPDRLLPTFSLDAALFFERNGNWFGNAIVHTLEPRLFYLATPFEAQDELPNFDTSNVTFSFPSLFKENRFSGSDKIGDANQLTAALTSRILSDSTGAELLRASIGQIYYFRDREVQLTSRAAADEESSSSVVAELATGVIQNWRFGAGIQWDPHRSDRNVDNGLFSMRYNDNNERVFNAFYNYTRDRVEQTDLSGRWPIANRWSVVGRWTYSRLFDETIQAIAGIEYDNCCWRIRLIGQQLLTDYDNDPVNSVLLQFQLKGLGGWGDANDEFLETNISGYQAN
ncbi:MAG: LPS assembly protein LptD [Chromatiaceae bacterium]|nr:LPS assembly protein LptD [Chromatiaceae bacterium]